MDTGSREENASKQKIRASVLIQQNRGPKKRAAEMCHLNHNTKGIYFPLRLASIASQILAATSRPPSFAMARMPDTLIPTNVAINRVGCEVAHVRYNYGRRRPSVRADLTVIATTLALYLAVTVSPGPNFAVISRLAVSGSRRAAFGASIGIGLASIIYATLSMAGLAVLLKEIGWLARAVQIGGGCYLIYLGVSSWIGAGALLKASGPATARSGWYGLRTGFIVDLSNPKSIAFFIGLYAVAVPRETALWAKINIVAGCFVVETLWYGLVAAMLSTPAALSIYKRLGKWIERTIGACLAGFGIRMIYERP
jgi:threonine/homoserine/homoserine lactone efflux protein